MTAPRAEATLRRSAGWPASRIAHLEERLEDGNEVVWFQLLDPIKTLAAVLPALAAVAPTAKRSRSRR